MARKPFERKDRFYKKAKKEGYVARSAYKLVELDQRFKIFRPGGVVVDLGCAPGGWFQVAQEKMPKGTLVGVDLLPLNVSLKPGNYFLQDDFTKASTQEWLKEQLGDKKADWVISDMSPNISGIKFRDEFQSYELCQQAFMFAQAVLKPQGGFICKIFPGPEFKGFQLELKKNFKRLTTVTPEATRRSSTEVYLVGC